MPEETNTEVIETPETPEVLEVSPEGVVEKFDYTGWNGNRDSLPEDVQDAYDGISSRYESTISALKSDIDSFELLFDGADLGLAQKEEITSLTTARDELQGKLAELEPLVAKLAELEEKFKNLGDEHSQYKKTIEDSQAVAEKKWLAEWKTEHPKIATEGSPENKRFLSILTHFEDVDIAVEMVSLSDKVIETAHFYKNEQNCTESIALRLAKADHGIGKQPATAPKPPERQPRSAHLTSGARVSPVPHVVEQDIMDNTVSLADARKAAATKAFNKSRG